MKLKDISTGLRLVGDVARASERLFDSLAASRNSAWPVIIGVGVGLGLGALAFNENARQRVKAWLAGPDVRHRANTPPPHEVAAQPS